MEELEVIPTFGIIDSNTDPTAVNFPIPANDDSVKCLRMIMDYIVGNISNHMTLDKVNDDKSIDTESNDKKAPKEVGDLNTTKVSEGETKE